MNFPGIQTLQAIAPVNAGSVASISPQEWNTLFRAVVHRLTHAAVRLNGVPMDSLPFLTEPGKKSSSRLLLESPSSGDIVLDCVHALEQLHVALCAQDQQGDPDKNPNS